jgi:iron complex outermembrane receptor protein
MKKIVVVSGIFVFLSSVIQTVSGQNTKEEVIKLDSIVVEAYRAGKNTPVSYSELNYKEVRKVSPVNSVPMALGLMPSVVTSSEGGNGLGYSSMRIRGSEGSRINVTLNGVALNDSESQEVFWVNIPSFASIIEDIQVQRGVGTSTNGPGAFGASINIRSLHASSQAYGLADLGIASYNSYMTTFGAGTGLMKKAFTFDIRFSRSGGDGYIDRARTELNSLFATAGWIKNNSYLRLTYIMGDQVSGITWEGISRDQMEVDRRYNPAGLWHDPAGNERFYDNETDNYTQHHLQLSYSLICSDNLKWNTTLHYTKGDGYYENYKEKKKFSSYGLENQMIENVQYNKSDFIVRQAMDNGYYAVNTNFQYNSTRTEIKTGISFSYYDGDHFGNVVWSMYDNNIPDNFEWYMNKGYKSDASAFLRSEYKFSEKLHGYADLQYRNIQYRMRGEDKDFAQMNYSVNYNFFNPKIGLTYNLSTASRFYLSAAVGRREPGRTDIKESVKAGRADELKAERVIDYEAGYRFLSKSLSLEACIYMMEYKDQLVPTGKLSETGYVIKENVERSYRRGVELSAAWRLSSKLTFDGNVTLSKNIIEDYTSWIDVYDNSDDWNPLPQESTEYKKTDIAFSPGCTGMGRVTYYAPGDYIVSFNGKYVGKQYYDNTSDDSRSIPSYFVAGMQLSKEFNFRGNNKIGISFYVDNLFNRKYFSNAWVYLARFADSSSLYVEEGVYPQAERNYTLRVSLSF